MKRNFIAFGRDAADVPQGEVDDVSPQSFDSRSGVALVSPASLPQRPHATLDSSISEFGRPEGACR